MDCTEMGSPRGEVWFNDEKRVYIPADPEVAERLSRACESLDGTQVLRGRIASGDIFVAGRDNKAGIADAFGALACEMEGAAVGQVCWRNDVPFAILRCISDDYSGEAFVDFMQFRSIAAEKAVKAVGEFIRLSA